MLQYVRRVKVPQETPGRSAEQTFPSMEEQMEQPGRDPLLTSAAEAGGHTVARAVDRDGKPPVPVITAHDHCAWPNLTMLRDGHTPCSSFDATSDSRSRSALIIFCNL